MSEEVTILRLQGGKANAMSETVLDMVERLVDDFEASDARAAVLVGYERYFSAGLALPLLVELDRPAMKRFIERFGAVMLRVFCCARPIVAAINGHAIAGGCVLALQCDWRVMVDGAETRIGLNETQLGIGLPSSVLESLKLAVPPASLVPIAYEGRLFAPAEALALGLVHEVVGAGELEARALGRARALAAVPSTGVAQVKLGLRRAALETIARVSAEETERWLDTWFSPPAQERLAATVAKLPSLMLEVARIDGAPPTLVFLHEGLGSRSAWRDFPALLAGATGRAAIVGSRAGYGRSPMRPAPWPVDFMHDEARHALPALLAAEGVDDAILVGHSDGASIAPLYAGEIGRGVRALVLEAPHVFVEDETVASIAALAEPYAGGELRQRLGRRHDDVDATFGGWRGVWLDPAFRRWNIESALGGVRVPTLVIQGEDDQYGTVAQVDAVRRGVGGPCETLLLPECGHAPHRDQPTRTLAAMADFIARVTRVGH